jgi:hypothetical protein
MGSSAHPVKGTGPGAGPGSRAIGAPLSVIRHRASTLRERLREPKPRCRALVRQLATGRAGLEIGGPTAMFQRSLPVYPVIERLDNVNFSNSTTWEGEITEGNTFAFHPRRAPGRQYILEATDLASIPDGAYGLLLSSHTLEHTANPLQALSEWRRVLAADGCLIMVLPHKEGTFDHRRPVTTLEHLIADFEHRTGEDDLSHYDEIMALHDLALDPGAGSPAAFATRSKDNAVNRCFHQHVFDTNLALAVIDQAGFQALAVEPLLPHHIIVVAQSVESPDNAQVMGPEADWRAASPFRLDDVGDVPSH